MRRRSKLSRRCEAFEDRIPGEIWVTEVDHRKPYKGDNGIQFEFQDDTSQLPWLLKDIPLEDASKVFNLSLYLAEFAQKDE